MVKSVSSWCVSRNRRRGSTASGIYICFFILTGICHEVPSPLLELLQLLAKTVVIFSSTELFLLTRPIFHSQSTGYLIQVCMHKIFRVWIFGTKISFIVSGVSNTGLYVEDLHGWSFRINVFFIVNGLSEIVLFIKDCTMQNKRYYLLF